jgi:hypothetical protein
LKTRKRVIGILALIGTVFLSTQAFGYWIEDEHGWKFLRPDGSYIEESLEWIDGNFDGCAEMYYFDQDGYCLQSTQTFTQSARVLIKIEYRGSKLPTSTTLKALANRFDTAQNEKVTEMGVKLGKMNQLEECYKKLSLEDKDEECSEYDGDDEFIDEMKNPDKEKETQK